MWRLLVVALFTATAAWVCGGGLSDEEELAHRLEKFRTATFMVTYEVTFEGPTAPSGTYRMIQYQQANRIRADVETEMGLATGIVREDRSYRCTAVPAGDTGRDGCVIHPGNDVTILSYPATAFWNEIHRPHLYPIVNTSERTIVGLRAKCFVLGPKESKVVETELCLSQDGLLLFGQSTLREPAPSMSLIATEVTSDLPERIFEPPYPVTGESEICQRIEC